ncbi:MAG: phosphohydrolase [Chitinophagaceae bacterium]|nr:MAG: phosphohydrolase [Chitinophagaceae bacterium]
MTHTEEFAAIYKDTEAHITELFENYASDKHRFHNLKHTYNVVERVNEIAGHYELDDREMLILSIAAWFHDAGYLFVEPAMHEVKSVELMQVFLRERGVGDDIINEVAGCILATRAPRNPINQLQEILCDADTYHFGTKEFKESNKLAYQEFQLMSDQPLDEADLREQTLHMLQDHEFYTSYCKDLLTAKKEGNMKKLKKKGEEKQAEKELKASSPKKVKAARATDENGETDAPLIDEKQGTTKGMQTMLRLTSANHIQLSEMADSKANILISVNAIIISLILSILLRKLQTDPYLTIPAIIFLATSVATIITAILATRPKLSSGTFAEEDVQNKKTNLLFFGNFHKMPMENYENAMRTMMNDPDYLYSSIIQDIYNLGAVLGKKYRLIRIAYNLFMFGIIISVVAFCVAAIFNTAAAPDAALPNGSGSPF